MKHAMVQANGASFHVAQTGQGAPLLLLHGWPEFWLTWEPVMERLAERYRAIQVELRLICAGSARAISRTARSARRSMRPTCSHCWTHLGSNA